ncbi:MAG: 3-phosphoshikimate 1-carboxyvinyltransferase [Odoribacteraceae bacterium]|jgi:3-phosphoshikimate 1-carboxyvinyltransferase|nr:3-phosphoshikimate 1-carboxyvinyltransferase [Odoribacteraceae bacterium]
MKRLVEASGVSGTVVAPASKSAAQRAIVAALLAKGESVLRHVTPCDDTLAAVGVASALGATVETLGEECRVTSDFFAGRAGERHLSCGESGLLARMITPVAALLPGVTHVSGSGSLLTRPVEMLVRPLRQLGVEVTTTGGCLPLVLKGALRGGEATVDGTLGSQALTGLLMALPLAPRDSILHVTGLKSKPYIDMTIELLQAFGAIVEHDDYRVFTVRGGQAYRPRVYDVAGDWSGASCLLVAGCIAGSVTVSHLDDHSMQADRAILEVLRRSGAGVEVWRNGHSSGVTTTRGDAARSFEFDAGECPDLFPALVALAACCKGTSRIIGADRLIHKESNRALVLQQEFGKLGISILVDGNVMLVTGGEIGGGELSAHDDHRIAMSLATAALRATGTVTIDGAECVNKSYPRFWNDLERLQRG